MNTAEAHEIFTKEKLDSIFPPDRADHFFDALYGDVREGAYDISLFFAKYLPESRELLFEFHLKQRPGKCLACNLTYGLPQVFSRHPLINIKGLVQEIEKMLRDGAQCADWQLGATREISRSLHMIPLTIRLQTS
ncbi:MAG: pancreas/duodenum homeobox protein 1 [Desulfococcaceae bacterium]|jgi:hypothetical protein|nr:pancreas/duodenum homeobox protein 1 [Desulfococcaceae bacterium]